jgi:hypothetical protein
MVLEATVLCRDRPKAMLWTGVTAVEFQGDAGPIWDLVRAP